MKIRGNLLSIFLVLLIMKSQLQAACFYTVTAPVINFTLSENNNESTEYELSLNRGNSSDSKCETFLVGFSEGGSSSYHRFATNPISKETFPYNLYKSNNSTTMLRKVEDSSSLSQVLNGKIARNSTAITQFYFKPDELSSSSLIRGGIYKDTLSLSVHSGELNNLSKETISSLQVNISVPKMASLSLVNVGETYNSFNTSKTLDFGELTENEEMKFDVIVLSNAGYNLSVSSLNHQLMQLQGASSTISSQIGYLFYSQNSLKNISSNTPISILNAGGVTPIQGVRVPIKIVIQSVEGKNPGIYQDYLTFTIATTE